MAKAKTTIKIDGEKLRSLLEDTTGKTIYQIAEESGYSKNVLSNAIHNGYASSAVQNIARLYGIAPDEYKLKDPEPTEEIKGQISIDDIETIKREELKALFKQAIREAGKDPLAEVKAAYNELIAYFNASSLKAIIKGAVRESGFKAPELKALIKEAVREEIKEFNSLIYQRGFDDGYAQAVGDGYGKKEGK